MLDQSTPQPVFNWDAEEGDCCEECNASIVGPIEVHGVEMHDGTAAVTVWLRGDGQAPECPEDIHRRAWDAVAHGWWIEAQRQAVRRFGLTVHPGGHRFGLTAHPGERFDGWAEIYDGDAPVGPDAWASDADLAGRVKGLAALLGAMAAAAPALLAEAVRTLLAAEAEPVAPLERRDAWAYYRTGWLGGEAVAVVGGVGVDGEAIEAESHACPDLAEAVRDLLASDDADRLDPAAAQVLDEWAEEIERRQVCSACEQAWCDVLRRGDDAHAVPAEGWSLDLPDV